jgi:hypothetical protein
VTGRGAVAIRSAVWAAWGDAFGFPTELASALDVRRRLGGEQVKGHGVVAAAAARAEVTLPADVI